MWSVARCRHSPPECTFSPLCSDDLAAVSVAKEDVKTAETVPYGLLLLPRCAPLEHVASPPAASASCFVPQSAWPRASIYSLGPRAGGLDSVLWGLDSGLDGC